MVKPDPLFTPGGCVQCPQVSGQVETPGSLLVYMLGGEDVALATARWPHASSPLAPGCQNGHRKPQAELIVCCREPRCAVESLQIYPGMTESRSEALG